MKTTEKKYSFATLAVDIAVLAIINNELCVLLVRNEKEPFKNLFALPGGLVLESEELEAAIERVLEKKVNMQHMYYEQVYTFGSVDRDPRNRVVTVSYLSLLSTSQAIQLRSEKYVQEFIPVKKLPILAYDHNAIIEKAVERLKAKLEYTNIVYSLLPAEFTLSDLQKTYEIILERQIDKRNFRRKLLSLKLIEELPNKRKGEANRPAALYRFRQRHAQIVEIL